MGETPNQTSALMEMVRDSNVLVISGYSAAKGIGVGKYIQSDVFTVGGYEWATYFYPDGQSPEVNSRSVSMYVAMLSEGRVARALFELTLIDQSGKGNHRVRTDFDRRSPFPLKFQQLWGFKRFFGRVALEMSDYLRDDCLKLYSTVGVVVPAVADSTLCSIQLPREMVEKPTPSCTVMETVSGSNLFVIQGYSAAKGIGPGNCVASNELPACFHCLHALLYSTSMQIMNQQF